MADAFLPELQTGLGCASTLSFRKDPRGALRVGDDGLECPKTGRKEDWCGPLWQSLKARATLHVECSRVSDKAVQWLP